MIRYLLGRLVGLLPVLLGIAFLVFAMVRLVPGDPVRVMLGERASPERVAEVRSEFGLDQPLLQQFVGFVGRLARGDLGRSIKRNEPVAVELGRAFPATLELTVFAMGIAVVVGISLGILAALYRNSWLDSLATGLSLSGISIPIFWLGLALIVIFSVTLDLLPFGGRAELWVETRTGLQTLDSLLAGSWDDLMQAYRHLILPSLTLATVPTAMIARMTRSSLVEVLGQDYIRTAYAKGLSSAQVLWRHALPNAMLSILTIIGLQFGYLIGGAVLTEHVFAWPGLGTLVLDAVKSRDYPLVQGAVLLIAVCFSLVNLMVDALYGWLDPRVRYD